MTNLLMSINHIFLFIYFFRKEKELYIIQLGHILYANRVHFEWLRETTSIFMTDRYDQVDAFLNRVSDLVPPSTISQNFQTVARELDILQPKTPDEVFKERSHLFYSSNCVNDGIRLVIANVVTSGFVNAGFTTDLVLMASDPDWHNKLRHTSCLTAVACIGLVYLWDMDEGLLAIDKYLYSSDSFIKVIYF